MARRCTLEQIKSFLESPLWADLLEELSDWKTRAESEYGSCTDLLHLGKIQGRSEALIFMMSLPDVIHEEIEAEYETRMKDSSELEDDTIDENLEDLSWMTSTE